MLTKTIDYLDAFSRFKKKENVEAVERLLTSRGEFKKFERAQLGMCAFQLSHLRYSTSRRQQTNTTRRSRKSGRTSYQGERSTRQKGENDVGCVTDATAQIGSLCCETAEEAKTLIPSIQNKISDEDLQDLLDEMYKLMPR